MPTFSFFFFLFAKQFFFQHRSTGRGLPLPGCIRRRWVPVHNDLPLSQTGEMRAPQLFEAYDNCIAFLSPFSHTHLELDELPQKNRKKSRGEGCSFSRISSSSSRRIIMEKLMGDKIPAPAPAQIAMVSSLATVSHSSIGLSLTLRHANFEFRAEEESFCDEINTRITVCVV